LSATLPNIVNLTLLSRDLLKGVDLSASVYNLFDSPYPFAEISPRYHPLSP
jgi:hypothetical protein